MIDVTNVSFANFGVRSHQGKPFEHRRRTPPVVMRKQEPPKVAPKLEEEPAEKVLSLEPVIKHPLENTWTLWYFAPEKNKTWEQSQRKVSSFNTCEDFWSLYNHLKKASEVNFGCDLSLFKDDVRPMWEDAANKNGGRWLVNLDRRMRINGSLDRFWLELLLCMIGEAFGDNSEEICGAVFNARPRMDKLALWTGNSQVEDQVMGIGRVIKERLGLGNMLLEYGSHSDTAAKVRGSMKNVLRL